jgi:S-adenosylmethionine hydrolase
VTRARPPSGPARSGIVSLLTDFGPGSVYVGQLHATILRLAPAARIVDLAHDMPFGNTESAAYVLRRSVPHFPEGTVHVVVVDPGVGSRRAVLAAFASGHAFVAPDTGVLGALLAADPQAVVRRVENRAVMNPVVSSTFHGRDVMAPAAARLAAGGAIEDFGPSTTPRPAPAGPAREGRAIVGSVLLVDVFGNLITNIPGSALDELGGPGAVRLRIGAAFIDTVATTFSDVPKGVALVYVGSGEHIEVAVNEGRAADALRVAVGDRIRLEPRT